MLYRSRKLMATLMLVVCLIVVAGDSAGLSLIAVPAAAQVDIGDEVIFDEALIGQVQRINPLLAGLNSVDADIASLIFEGLMRVNEYGEPVPALAAEMPIVSFDGLEYVVRLRDDVLWQDGMPFTSADVVYTTALLADPSFPGPRSLGAFWQTVETEALGDYLVRFRIAQPLGSFMEALRIGILPVHALSGTDASRIASHPFNLDPIGTGPYQLETMRGDGTRIRQIDLRRSPVYAQRVTQDQVPDIPWIRFHIYDNFEAVMADMEAGNITAFATSDAGQRQSLLAMGGEWLFYTSTLPDMGMILFNWTAEDVGFFGDQRIRQALSIGIARTAPVERFLSNAAVRLDGPLPPGTWATVPLNMGAAYPWPESEPDVARDLLTRAGARPLENDPDGAVLRFSLLTPDDPALIGLANDLATQWSQYGIVVTIDPQLPDVYRTRLEAGDFDAVLTELSLTGRADPDVYAFWHQGQYPDGLNYGGVNDTVISEELERGRSDFNGANRQIHYANFQRTFIERAIAIPLYVRLYTYVVSSNVNGVQLGYIASSYDRFFTLPDWVVVP